MKIEMIEVTDDYCVDIPGKYLVRTVSTGPIKSIQFLQARVTINEKNGKRKMSVDVNNQTVTHISKEQL